VLPAHVTSAEADPHLQATGVVDAPISAVDHLLNGRSGQDAFSRTRERRKDPIPETLYEVAAMLRYHTSKQLVMRAPQLVSDAIPQP
jgi:hypothetical protein